MTADDRVRDTAATLVRDRPRQRPTVAEQVAGEIVDLIEASQLRPGDDVPAEGELTRRFGVNRLAVREAIRILTARGILASSQGRPTRVTVPDHRVFGDMLSFRLRQRSLGFADLVDTRRAIEGAIVRQAAERAGSGRADVHRAETLLADMAEARKRSDADAFIVADVAFHQELAAMAGSDTLRLLLDSLGSALVEARWSSYAGHLRRGRDLDETIEEHHKVLDAVRAGDPDLAAKAMDSHLDVAVEDLCASRPGDE